MADLFDVNGNPVLKKLEQQKALFDASGNPLDLSRNPMTHEVMRSPTLGDKEWNYIGSLGAESLPFAGSFFGPEGTAAGAVAKNLLKSYFPKALGEGATDIGGLAGDVGGEILAQNVVPHVVGAAVQGGLNLAKGGIARLVSGTPLKYLPTVREAAVRQMVGNLPQVMQESEAVGRGASQATAQPIKADFPLTDVNLAPLGNEYQPIKITKETAPFQPIKITPGEEYQPLRKGQSFQPSSQPTVGVSGPPKQVPAGYRVTPDGPVRRTILDDMPDGGLSIVGNNFKKQGENEIGDMLLKYDKEAKAGDEVAKTQTVKEIANKTLSDVIHVNNAKLATGGTEFTNNLAVNRLLGTGDKIPNAISVLQELRGPKNEIYSAALHPDTYQTLNDTLEEITKQQEKGTFDRIINYSKGKLVWNLGSNAVIGGALGHPVLGGAYGLAKTGVPIFTNAMLGKAMENPVTARAVLMALRTPASAAEAPLLRKIIEGSVKFGGAAEMASQ